MKRAIVIGTLSLMVFVSATMLSWGQDGAPQGPGQGQHQMGDGQHGFDGQQRFMGDGHGQFGHQGWEGHGRGMRGGHRGFHGGMGGGGFLRMAENPRVRTTLGLSDEQVARLHKLGVDAEEASVKSRAQMQISHIELRELMRADNPDQSAIMAKMDQINSLRGQMEKARVQTMLSARSVLTPDQLKKVKTFMENRGGGMSGGQMMQHRGPGGWQGRPGGHGPNSAPPAPPANQ